MRIKLEQETAEREKAQKQVGLWLMSLRCLYTTCLLQQDAVL